MVLCKSVSYTIPQFLQMEREKELMKELGLNERNAKIIMMNKKLKILVTVALASIFSYQDAFAGMAPKVDKVTSAMMKVDSVGLLFLAIIRKIGYWICIVMCITEILRSLANGDTKSIGKIITKYLIAFGATYLISWMFDIIASIFG